MTKPLLERLRSYDTTRSGYARYCHEAADRIEQLETALLVVASIAVKVADNTLILEEDSNET